jgi:hypothetical protein
MPTPELNANLVLAAAKRNMPAIVKFLKEELADMDSDYFIRPNISQQELIAHLLDQLEQLVQKTNAIDQNFIEAWSKAMMELEKHFFSKHMTEIHLSLDDQSEKKLTQTFYDVTKVVDDQIAKQKASPRVVKTAEQIELEQTAIVKAHEINNKKQAIRLMQSHVTGIDAAAKQETDEIFASSKLREIKSLQMKYEALLKIQDDIKSLEHGDGKEAGHKKSGLATLFDSKSGSKKAEHEKIQTLQGLKEAILKLPVKDLTTAGFKEVLDALKTKAYAAKTKGVVTKPTRNPRGTFTTSK